MPSKRQDRTPPEAPPADDPDEAAYGRIGEAISNYVATIQDTASDEEVSWVVVVKVPGRGYELMESANNTLLTTAGLLSVGNHVLFGHDDE